VPADEILHVDAGRTGEAARQHPHDTLERAVVRRRHPRRLRRARQPEHVPDRRRHLPFSVRPIEAHAHGRVPARESDHEVEAATRDALDREQLIVRSDDDRPVSGLYPPCHVPEGDLALGRGGDDERRRRRRGRGH
jgi:hypothetical protein